MGQAMVLYLEPCRRSAGKADLGLPLPAVEARRHLNVETHDFVIQYASSVAFIFADSAFRHGITAPQIEYVIAHCGLVYDEPAPPGSAIPDDRSLYLGDDEQGAALEVAAIAVDDSDLLVVHAMKLRDKYREQYNHALAARKLA